MADLKAGVNQLFLREEELRTGMELLFYAYREFTAEPDEILAEIGFGRAHHRVIYFVGRYPRITVSELLAILKITKQSLSRVLGELVRQGFIVRTRADDGTVEARANDTARRNAAFASGAQIVTTDFLTPDRAVGAYRASLQDNPRALCGVALGSEHCVGLDAPRAIAAR